jgi:perosamine synthetase
MGKIMKIAKKHRLKVVEDACESIGATYAGKMAGTFGDVGVFAFYPNKQMTTGEGGMVVTNSKKIYELCCSLRNQGRDNNADAFVHERLGYNYRMDEMSASLGVTQLKKIDWMLKKRKAAAELYNKYLGETPHVTVPMVAENCASSWFVYVVRINNRKRDRLRALLKKDNIQTKAYLPVIHLQPFMKSMFGYRKGDFPVAEAASSQTLALPFFIGLTPKEIKRVASIISRNI